MVFYALKERLRLDDDSRVRYEAAKSLILLGNLSYFSIFQGSHKLRKSLKKPGKSPQKVPCMEKSWNLKKTE